MMMGAGDSVTRFQRDMCKYWVDRYAVYYN
jgi:hypothetical protein